MSPRVREFYDGNNRPPRVSGDEPIDQKRIKLTLESAPRKRG